MHFIPKVIDMLASLLNMFYKQCNHDIYQIMFASSHVYVLDVFVNASLF